MAVECKFIGGPMDGLIGAVSSLVQCQVFFDERGQKVYLYNRIDELVYEYHPDVSRALSLRYDEAREKLAKTPQSVERWTGKTHNYT